MRLRLLLLIVMIQIAAVGMLAQTPELGYQGSLKNSGLPANGNYDFVFTIYDSLVGGGGVGIVVTRTNVPVVDGLFAVTLNFNGAIFNQLNRFLEIQVRPTGGTTYTVLSPRQQLVGVPYALKATFADGATNAIQLGGIDANQYVITTDTRLSDARTPTAGSGNYIQNGITVQGGSNFNISGNGTAGGTISANVVNSSVQYNLGGVRVLAVNGVLNPRTSVGVNAGVNGSQNSFFGYEAGAATTGNGNSFFGSFTGRNGAAGSGNSFFGNLSGQSSTGSDNTFVGAVTGDSNTTGSRNVFVGQASGLNNTTGNDNVFIGRASFPNNTIGSNNTLLGSSTNTIVNSLQYATAIGSSARVGTSDTIVLGKEAGNYNSVPRPADNVFAPGSLSVGGSIGATTGFDLGGSRILSIPGTRNLFTGVATGAVNTGIDNTFVGYVAGDENTSGGDNTFLGSDAGGANTTGSGNTFIGSDAGDTSATGNNNTVIGSNADVGGAFSFATAIGAGSTAGASNTISLGRADGSDRTLVRGVLDLQTLEAGGSIHLCRTASNHVGDCSSSLRYKTNIGAFTPGLSLINRLRPITFDWKDGGMHDLGLGAEDVADIEPLLVNYNKAGRIEGVKYDRIGVVLVNAVKEQQKTIERQQSQIDALTKLVCAGNNTADICKER